MDLPQTAMAGRDDCGPPLSEWLCETAHSVTGAGVVLMGDDHLPRASVWSTDGLSALLEELQFTLGEGPCVDAHRLERPVLAPELGDSTVPTWPAFTIEAVAAGASAVFAFPLHTSGVQLGALCLYADRPGALSDDQHAKALVVANVLAAAVLSYQARAAPYVLAAELEDGSDFHSVVHQAAGMVSVQMGSTVATALVQLRAHAFAEGRRLSEMCADVVDRALRFDPGGHNESGRKGAVPNGSARRLLCGQLEGLEEWNIPFEGRGW